ncbi:MAG: MFS transporter, partial [Chloroflexota bacterium]
LSNIIFIPIAVFVIAAYNWRAMFVAFAIVTMLVVIIPSIVLMRRRPEDMGLHPDGVATDTKDIEASQSQQSSDSVMPVKEPIWSRRDILSNSTFWILALCMGIDSLALQGLNISMAPYIQDLGYGDATLASVLTFRAIIMVATLPLAGLVAERIQRARWRVIPFIIQSVAALLFLLAGRPALLWLAVGVYGIGVSSFAVMVEVVWANYFGRLSLGQVRSLSYLTALGFGAAGPIAISVVFDFTGSYKVAFVALSGLLVSAAVLIGIVKPPQARHYATLTPLATESK